MQARAEGVGNFDRAQLAARGRDDVEQDLEALRGKLRRQLLEAVAADHEEAAHGIGDLDAEHALGDFGRQRTGAGALLVETVGAAALDIAAADHEFGLAALQQRRASSAVASRRAADRRRSRRHRARWRPGCPRCRRRTGRAGRCGGCSGRGGSCCARPRTTSQVPSGELSSTNTTSQAMSAERRLQPPVQRGDVVALVEGRDDDRKLRQTGGLRRVFGARFDGFIHGGQRIAAAPAMPRRQALAGAPKARNITDWGKTGQNRPKNANDHEQRARVHPAQPSHSWSSQRRSF